MLTKSLLFNNNFWEIIALIARSDNQENLERVFKEVPLSHKELDQIFEFIQSFDFDIRIKRNGTSHIIQIPCQKEKLQFILSFSDWLSLQYHFINSEPEAEQYFKKFVTNKIEEIKLKFPGYNFFNFPDHKKPGSDFPELRNMLGESFVESLEACIFDGLSLTANFRNGQSIDLYPKRVLFIEDNLSLVGEDIHDKCLTYFSLRDLKSFQTLKDKKYKSNFTNLEINDFISQIRMMNGKEVRLILRVIPGEEVELNPPFHLMGNPCLITNFQGQKIYAATVEITDEFFNWYHENSQTLEIIEPIKIQEAYQDFLSRKTELFKKSA